MIEALDWSWVAPLLTTLALEVHACWVPQGSSDPAAHALPAVPSRTSVALHQSAGNCG